MRQATLGVAVVVISSSLFGATPVALAQSRPLEALSTFPPRTLRVSDVTIPEDAGYVVDTHAPAASPRYPMLVHIQEAHADPQAQRHLVAVLEQLIGKHGLRLIMVEGGEGDVRLSSLRSYAPADHRRSVAQRYLSLGLISGEEYVDLISEYPLILWGIEEEGLYQRNVDAFLESEAVQDGVMQTLTSVRETLSTLQPRLFDSAVNELHEQQQAFNRDQLDVNGYADYLVTLAKRLGVSQESYPQVRLLREVHEVGQRVDRQAVAREQQALIRELRARHPSQALQDFLASAKRSTTLKAEEFYPGLEQLAREAKVSLEAYPHLSGYIRSIAQSAQMNVGLLSEELDRLAAQLRRALLSTPQSRRLDALLTQVELVELLAQHRLSPSEYAQFQALHLEQISSTWSASINELLKAQGLPTRMFAGLDHLDAALPILVRFYEVAKARDGAIVTRVLETLKESHEPLAVLITGGFHALALSRRLKEEHIPLVTVALKVSATADESLYTTVMRFKRGQASFDEVQNIATASHNHAVIEPQR